MSDTRQTMASILSMQIYSTVRLYWSKGCHYDGRCCVHLGRGVARCCFLPVVCRALCLCKVRGSYGMCLLQDDLAGQDSVRGGCGVSVRTCCVKVHIQSVPLAESSVWWCPSITLSWLPALCVADWSPSTSWPSQQASW